MAARRCSTCAIDHPTNHIGGCRGCQGELNYFADIDPHSPEEISDRVAKLAWSIADNWPADWGGITAVERYVGTVQSLAGADDFLYECGPWTPPVGQDWGWKKKDTRPVYGPPAPETS